MPRKKTRIKKLKERQRERQENNWKKNQYHKMSLDGVLGNKELEKYAFMYSYLNGQRDSFPSPEEGPKRDDYKRIRNAYNSLGSKLF